MHNKNTTTTNIFFSKGYDMFDELEAYITLFLFFHFRLRLKNVI